MAFTAEFTDISRISAIFLWPRLSGYLSPGRIGGFPRIGCSLGLGVEGGGGGVGRGLSLTITRSLSDV